MEWEIERSLEVENIDMPYQKDSNGVRHQSEKHQWLLPRMRHVLYRLSHPSGSEWVTYRNTTQSPMPKLGRNSSTYPYLRIFDSPSGLCSLSGMKAKCTVPSWAAKLHMAKKYQRSILFSCTVPLFIFFHSIFSASLSNLVDSRPSSSLSGPSIIHIMASTERYRHGSLKRSPSFYPPPPPPPESQAIWRSDQDPTFHPTALDRFEEQWRSSQGRLVPDEKIPSPVRLDFERIRSPAASPPPSANAPFYVPRRYESPAYPQQDQEDIMMSPGPEPVRREQMYVQVNQALRTPNLRPPIPLYQPRRHPQDMDRQSNHSLPPYDRHQPSYERPAAPRPATVPPQYRQQPQPRHPRPDSRSRHNPYSNSESRRRRRSSSSQARRPSKRRFASPQHFQRQFPSRPPLL
ncbi:hypothetical protein BDZ45DRAFT_697561 [Acephala macrosclerotiorum]|nr:hypothetical protein BDZ45DRAFT_697561 [Acephala macrosclerotiorum]